MLSESAKFYRRYDKTLRMIFHRNMILEFSQNTAFKIYKTRCRDTIHLRWETSHYSFKVGNITSMWLQIVSRTRIPITKIIGRLLVVMYVYDMVVIITLKQLKAARE